MQPFRCNLSVVDSYRSVVLESTTGIIGHLCSVRTPTGTVMPWRIVVQLSEYSLDRLRDDGELVLYRAHAKQTERPSVLLLTPASTRPSPETLKKINHEYSLRSELDSAFAVRPLALSERSARMALVLENPGGKAREVSEVAPLGG